MDELLDKLYGLHEYFSDKSLDAFGLQAEGYEQYEGNIIIMSSRISKAKSIMSDRPHGRKDVPVLFGTSLLHLPVLIDRSAMEQILSEVIVEILSLRVKGDNND